MCILLHYVNHVQERSFPLLEQDLKYLCSSTVVYGIGLTGMQLHSVV
jgi:hypothetical protein